MTEFAQTPVTPVAPVPSDLAQTLLEAGATPTVPNVEQMLATITALQTQVNGLMAERGIPTDPIAAKIQNIADHINARSAQYPAVDLSEIKDILDNWPADSTQAKAADSDLLKLTVEEHLDMYRGLELSYLGTLARELHKEVLKAGQ